MMNRYFAPVFLALLIFSGGAFALSEDRNEAVEITSKTLEADNVRQIAIYTGGVVLTQGTLKMTGTRLTLQITPQGYKRLTLEGNPARFSEVSSVSKGVQTRSNGRAPTIVYDEKTGHVTLSPKATVWKSRSGKTLESVSGGKILYNMRSGNAVLQKSGSGTNKIVLPGKKP